MANQTGRFHKKAVQGLTLFNQKKFYEAHEYFEEAWRDSPEYEREFYRALLQLSGGFYRLSQGRPAAAKKFFKHALHWLGEFPNKFLGFNNRALEKYLHELINAINTKIDSTSLLQYHFQPLHRLDEKDSS